MRGLEQVLDEASHRAPGERLEREREVIATSAAPVRPSVEQLRTGEDDHEDRRIGPGLHDVLDEIEQAVRRPMEILEDDHQRSAPRGQLDRIAPRREQGCTIGDLAFAGADSSGEQIRGICAALEGVLGEPRCGALAHRHRCCVVSKTDEPVEDSAQRPVREALPVRQALRHGDPRVGIRLRHSVEKFLQQSRLPRARGRDEAHEEWPLLGKRAPRNQLELFEIGVAAKERDTWCHAMLEPADERVSGDGLSFALCAKRSPLGERKSGPRCTGRALAAEDSPRLGRLLKSRCDVHGVARYQEIGGLVLARRDDLAGVDADADRNALSERRVAAHAVTNLERRRESALGIVAVGLPEAEHGHDRIADEFLDRTAVLSHDVLRRRVEPTHECANVLGIHVFAECGRSHDVGEEDGHDAAFLRHGGSLPYARRRPRSSYLVLRNE